MNQYLIDTHILLWYVEGNPKLSQNIISILENDYNQIFISFASFWEISIKASIGKLELQKSLAEFEKYLLEQKFILLNYSFKHLEVLLTLEMHHQDPFDRMIIAQALYHDLAVISDDAKFEKYAIKLIQN